MITKKDENGKWRIARPSKFKKEYHGNGKNAWYGQVEEINGHKVEYVSHRYSYRWHKMIVFFDDRRLLSSKDYHRAENLLNQ